MFFLSLPGMVLWVNDLLADHSSVPLATIQEAEDSTGPGKAHCPQPSRYYLMLGELGWPWLLYSVSCCYWDCVEILLQEVSLCPQALLGLWIMNCLPQSMRPQTHSILGPLALSTKWYTSSCRWSSQMISPKVSVDHGEDGFVSLGFWMTTPPT